MAASRDEATIAINEFNATTPSELKLDADTNLRRKSGVTSLPRTGEAYSTTADADGNAQTDDENWTYESYTRRALPHLDSMSGWSAEDIQDDLETKVYKLAEYYGKRTDTPSFPYRSITKDGKDHIHWSGSMDFAVFDKLYNDFPEEMFIEMKARTLMAIALRQQVHQLFQISLKDSDKIEVLKQWIDHLAGPDYHRSVDPDPHQQQSSDAANAQFLQQALDELATCRQELADKDREINDTNSDLALLVREVNLLRRGASPGGQSNHSTNNKDAMKFDPWYKNLKTKLTVNADHFADDKAKCVYIEGRLAGDASNDLFPYLDDTHPDQLNTPIKLLEHLYNNYHDFNADENAKDQYNNLFMQPSSNYQDFQNEFNLLVGHEDDPDCDFHKYARLGGYLARNLRKSYEDKKASSSKTNGTSSRPTMATMEALEAHPLAVVVPMQLDRKGYGTRSSTPSLSDAEMKKLVEEGRCFTCREQGHTSSDCPKKTPRPDRNARISAIIDAQEQHQERKKVTFADTANNGSGSQADSGSEN
ncbi:hypothetical protein B0H66DRAFT_593998 [Apodospora peruviana]|uniref:CCHC-type domain-containing protein n=1 Tax=Apodospora peruviana TaxID=516989 RepID=A0AAE0HYX3_9PEZI|nr:hypothetical protein B0H66DRAFT_593998 [Apodospora peruviana]